MKKIIENTERHSILTVIKGTAIAMAITIVLLIAFALILAYTNVSETIITPTVIITSGLSILIGSISSTRKIKKQGLLNGGLVGFMYMISIYIISSIIQGDFSVNTYSIIMIIVAIFTGLLGGIIGVNIRK